MQGRTTRRDDRRRQAVTGVGGAMVLGPGESIAYHRVLMSTRTTRFLRNAGIVLGVALLFGVLEALQARFYYRQMPWSRFWIFTIRHTLPGWLILAALFPLIYWLATRVRVTRTSWPRMLPIHIVAGVVIMTTYLVGVSAWSHRMDPSLAFSVHLGSAIANYFMLSYFMYCCLVAIFHAYHYQSEARQRELTALRLESGLAQARLQALRAQLNPHFLFNALNAISGLAVENEREKVTRMVSALSDLLRATLEDDGVEEIRLADELDVLDRYIEIQQTRFGDRLQVEKQIEPGLDDALVPRLLFQPLVENAVVHGASARPGRARILVRASRRDDVLRLEVIDDGPGFHASPRPGGHGIGLSNTRARLEQLYGDAQSLDAGTAALGGGSVVVDLPFRTSSAAKRRTG